MFKIPLAVFISLLFWSSFIMAQSRDDFDNGLDELYRTGGKEAVLSAICPTYLESDSDLEFPMLVTDCTKLGGLSLVEAEIVSSAAETSPSLGIEFLEAKNKWQWASRDEKPQFIITVVNPYRVGLISILIDYANGDCPSKVADRFLVTFHRPLEPKEAVIVGFDSPIVDLASSGCLDIVGSETKPLDDGQMALNRVIPMAEAGQWHEAVLLAEEITKSGISINSQTFAELQTTIVAGVRPLSANDSVNNFLGYAALVGLDRSDTDFAKKLERYRAASVGARKDLLRQAFERNLPFVRPDEVLVGLSSGQTRVQRDEAWSHYKDKTMSVTGRVSDVQPAGIILPASIVLGVAGDGQVICYLQDFLAEAIISVPLGSNLTCTGQISDYTLIFDSVTVSLRDAVFKK